MTDLSPAARAVLDAADNQPFKKPDGDLNLEGAIAAALRAAADQVVPPALEEEFHDRNQALPLKKMVEIRQKLNAIANELEGAQCKLIEIGYDKNTFQYYWKMHDGPKEIDYSFGYCNALKECFAEIESARQSIAEDYVSKFQPITDDTDD